jgi:hypothetical protein
MVEIIVTEAQLTCLKDATPSDSSERAALDAGDYFTGSVGTPERLISIRCSLNVAWTLLAIVKQSCPHLVPEIRAAIEEATI